MKTKLTALALTVIGCAAVHAADSTVVLFEDGFGSMRSGAIGNEVGAHLEYHYLPKVNIEGQWAISTFSSGAPSQREWRVARHNGEPLLLQAYENKLSHTRPCSMPAPICCGDVTAPGARSRRWRRSGPPSRASG